MNYPKIEKIKIDYFDNFMNAIILNPLFVSGLFVTAGLVGVTWYCLSNYTTLENEVADTNINPYIKNYISLLDMPNRSGLETMLMTMNELSPFNSTTKGLEILVNNGIVDKIKLIHKYDLHSYQNINERKIVLNQSIDKASEASLEELSSKTNKLYTQLYSYSQSTYKTNTEHSSYYLNNNPFVKNDIISSDMEKLKKLQNKIYTTSRDSTIDSIFEFSEVYTPYVKQFITKNPALTDSSFSKSFRILLKKDKELFGEVFDPMTYVNKTIDDRLDKELLHQIENQESSFMGTSVHSNISYEEFDSQISNEGLLFNHEFKIRNKSLLIESLDQIELHEGQLLLNQQQLPSTELGSLVSNTAFNQQSSEQILFISDVMHEVESLARSYL